jgi:hypothetical protein
MALVICTLCKRAFMNTPHSESVCPECREKMKKIYSTVRNFLRDHEKEVYTIYDVSRILGIELKDVEGLVTMGLIETSKVGKHVLKKKSDAKIRPLDAELAREILNSRKSSMHAYDKKKDEVLKKKEPK